MYVRVTRGSFDPARTEDLQRVAEQTIQAARELPGFRSLLIGVERTTSRLLAVSTWEAEDHAQAIGRLRAQAEAAGVRFETPPEMFEVIAQS